MPFSLKNAPSAFQRMMNAITADITIFVAAYINDVVIFSDSFQDNVKHLRVVLQWLEETGLKLKPEKCVIAGRSCQFLGHVVREGQIRPLEAKVKAVAGYPYPTKKKQMRAFLGLTNYYRCFIPGYGAIAMPLNDATRKLAPDRVEWTQEHRDAFEQLRTALISHPVLTSPEEAKPFTLHTDASGIGIGAVLSQDINGTDKPIAFYSRRLKPAEARYSVTEQECLGVVEAVRHFRVYLSGRPFRVVTYHRSLVYLHAMKDENGRLTRWALALQPYLFEVQHRPGVKHYNVDGLSRQSWGRATDEPDALSLGEEGRNLAGRLAAPADEQ